MRSSVTNVRSTVGYTEPSASRASIPVRGIVAHGSALAALALHRGLHRAARFACSDPETLLKQAQVDKDLHTAAREGRKARAPIRLSQSRMGRFRFRGAFAVKTERWRQIETVFQLMLARSPDDTERTAARKFFAAQPSSAALGEGLPTPPSALVLFCQAMLSINEFVYIE